MNEAGGGLGLAQETLAKQVILRKPTFDDFYRDLAAKCLALAGAIDLSHAANANALKQFIAAKPGSFCFCHMLLSSARKSKPSFRVGRQPPQRKQIAIVGPKAPPDASLTYKAFEQTLLAGEINLKCSTMKASIRKIW
jgi:hypothetical protein